MTKTIATAVSLLALVAAAQAQDVRPGDSGETTVMPAEQTASPPAPVQGTVARAAVTSAIEEREPVDDLATLTTEYEKAYYFTELRDMEGQFVTHRWEYNGEVVAEVQFDVGGPRWRVYSSKNLLPDWTGRWTVSVVDAAGNTLRTDTFEYQHAPVASVMPVEPGGNAATDAGAMQAEARDRR